MLLTVGNIASGCDQLQEVLHSTEYLLNLSLLFFAFCPAFTKRLLDLTVDLSDDDSELLAEWESGL